MILVFGTICLDRVMTVPCLPDPGGYVAIQSEQVLLGGEAVNTAVALRNWGKEVALYGNDLGSGPDGELLAHLLDEKGLLSDGGKPSHRTPVCDIYVTPDSERTMFGRGFDTMEPAIDVTTIPFQAGALFTAEPNMSRVSREVSREAARRGMRLYLMDFYKDEDPIGPGVYWQCSTDWVAFRGDQEANLRWVQDWVDRKGCFAVLTDGPRGLVAASPEMPARFYPPFPAPVVVDSTGAGDTFRAAMLVGLDNGLAFHECLAFAAAAGSLSCGYLGATTQTPTFAEVEEHMANHPQVLKGYR